MAVITAVTPSKVRARDTVDVFGRYLAPGGVTPEVTVAGRAATVQVISATGEHDRLRAKLPALEGGKAELVVIPQGMVQPRPTS